MSDNKRNHYVYLLESKVTKMYYIGVRSCKCAIWDDTYMGSSKHMTEEDKKNCNKIILKRFSSRKEAIDYEIKLHSKFDVGINPMFWNKAKQTSEGFDTTGRKMSDEERNKRGLVQKERFAKYGHPCLGKPQSEELKLKRAEAVRGRKHREGTKKLMSQKASGTRNSAFVPWWYEYDGIRTYVYDKTVKEMAELWGVPLHSLKDRFRSRYKGCTKTSDPLKGISVGRVKKHE